MFCALSRVEDPRSLRVGIPHSLAACGLVSIDLKKVKIRRKQDFARSFVMEFRRKIPNEYTSALWKPTEHMFTFVMNVAYVCVSSASDENNISVEIEEVLCFPPAASVQLRIRDEHITNTKVSPV